MTLRTKLLALLSLLAVGPLLAIGVIGYALSAGAVSKQLESQTRPIAERSAEEIRKRMARVESDLGLLAHNAETERLLDLSATSSSAPAEAAHTRDAFAAADSFFEQAWTLFAPSYESIELRDGSGRTLLSYPLDGEGVAEIPISRYGPRPTSAARTDGALVYEVGAGGSPSVGSVLARLRPEPLLDSDVFDTRFGRHGVSAVIHRPSGRVLQFADGSGRIVSTVDEAGLGEVVDYLEESGAIGIRSDGVHWLGWAVAVSSPPLTTITLSDLDEFEAPFRRQRFVLSALVLALAAAVLPVGAVLLRRATRSLDELTLAADRVGGGDLDPALPPAGGDEVGRLSAAFRRMLSDVQRMMAEIERSHQLAAVGAFASELSHEIRNPLTAIKLNLQRIERMVDAGEIPERGSRPVTLALREIARLDRVVRSALKLGRASDVSLERCQLEVSAVVERAVAMIAPQLATGGLSIHVEGDDCEIHGDDEELTGALVNLLLNAVEATPPGGHVDIRTTLAQRPEPGWVSIDIADTGSGIPESMRENLFRPFFTTRREGTGLGLALAFRAVEAHGGTLTLVSSSAAGTEFRIRIPLASAPSLT